MFKGAAEEPGHGPEAPGDHGPHPEEHEGGSPVPEEHGHMDVVVGAVAELQNCQDIGKGNEDDLIMDLIKGAAAKPIQLILDEIPDLEEQADVRRVEVGWQVEPGKVMKEVARLNMDQKEYKAVLGEKKLLTKRKVGQNEVGRRVLLAGRGRSLKKKKEGEMAVTRIEDLIARMGGRKRKNDDEKN